MEGQYGSCTATTYVPDRQPLPAFEASIVFTINPKTAETCFVRRGFPVHSSCLY